MIRLYNTLTKTKETLEPMVAGKIKMFVCGPTVYDYIHLGNARTFINFDVIAKYLRYRGYDLQFIQNITDIDDKIINKAGEQSIDALELAKDFENKFMYDMRALNISAVDEYPRATDYIAEIVKQVKALINRGNAYFIPDDGYYFDLSTFPDYGKLSGRTAEMADDGISRIDSSLNKHNKGDFCLWKLSKPDEPSWETELGKGRPGWHIEDTAITEKYFGPQYDIHGGGQDLMFPHHEAEIAQQESASGKKPFVKYWLHAGFITSKDNKMSKSLGNFITVHDLLKEYTPEALRFISLSAHYRAPLDVNQQSLKTAQAATSRLGEFYTNLNVIKTPGQSDTALDTIIADSKSKIEEAMDNDFNAPQAIGSLFSMIKDINQLIASEKIDSDGAIKVIAFLKSINDIFGIIPTTILAIPQDIQDLVNQREQARSIQDFQASDTLRSDIESRGYSIEDTSYGPLVKKAL